MNRLQCLAILALSVAFPASAQQGACPPLPAGTNLQWQEKVHDGFVLCRALDGERPVLSLMLTAKPTVNLLRRNRLEEGSIGSHEVRWYQPEMAVQTGAQQRITIVELGNDRYAQVWVEAASDTELRQLLTLAQSIPLY
ncbi:hypothetical protein [Pseudoxanthomonas suwonensis]|uniref:hypothetical protein n=1 Tax=Pseudoxanthomonas suwonensis TaxID=314722 RepID=UPI00048E8B01|nr:hypothetical protein [Pseudoxanthomonas suwonensis]